MIHVKLRLDDPLPCYGYDFSLCVIPGYSPNDSGLFTQYISCTGTALSKAF